MTLVCIINMFAFEQKVILYKDDHTKEILGMTPLETLDIFISDTCYSKKVNKIHLYGPEEYVNNLIEDIIEYSATNYLNTKLEFEVN